LCLFHTLVVFMCIYIQRWEVIVDFVIITVQIKSWGGCEIPLNDLTPPPFCACPKPGPGFTTAYVMVFFVFSELRWVVIVHFVDIVGIVNHHCLNFIFIKSFPFKFQKHWLIRLYNKLPLLMYFVLVWGLLVTLWSKSCL
jgi:hypothetical protein